MLALDEFVRRRDEFDELVGTRRLQGDGENGALEQAKACGYRRGAASTTGACMLTIDTHPLLDLHAFVTVFPNPLGEMVPNVELTALLSLEAKAPLASDDKVREAVRGLLRQGGFKPTGRSKPASEYLIKAAREKTLPPINPCVDVCNVV